MRFRTLEIRWHDSKPISTCDFQPVPFKRARPTHPAAFATQAWRLATGGEDNHVRLWMVHPNLMPPSAIASSSAMRDAPPPNPHPPRVEYVATLSRHTGAVNVVRFSPNGELIASAGDDGMIIIWAQSSTPHTSTYGSDISPEDLQYEREYWKPRTTFRCTTMQVYDLAWSPTGEYIIAGSTDNCARVFASQDGKCVYEIAEHNHYVQGVAWDPLNEYIATQSSDRSMHIYSISTKSGVFEAHAVGKNTRMHYHQAHTRTPSRSRTRRPKMLRSSSIVSDTESVVTTVSEAKDREKEESITATPMTPATSVGSTPNIHMFPPPSVEKSTSRRSSFSGSNAAGSPATPYAKYGRSPSPMPALPAIRALPSNAAWSSVKLYGDESFTNFFRRLTFSPDGGLLLTPAGQFEDPSVLPGSLNSSSSSSKDDQPTRGRKGGRKDKDEVVDSNSASSVFIYSRANFARPPIGQLPGHKKASVAVRFSPVLYELRKNVIGVEPIELKADVLERGKDGEMAVDLVDQAAPASTETSTTPHTLTPETSQSPRKPTPVLAPVPMLASSVNTIQSPITPTEPARPLTPAPSRPSTPQPGSVFALPYRMLFAVETMDTVTIYDTQQAGPVCMLTKLHYDEFTDMTWSPDGQTLMLSSRDGYCTIVIFDEILPAHHTQQQVLQLQSIAQQNSVPLINTPSSSSLPTTSTTSSQSHSTSHSPSIVPAKRSESQAQTQVSSQESATQTPTPVAPKESSTEDEKSTTEPPKKRRRVALTKVGEIGS